MNIAPAGIPIPFEYTAYDLVAGLSIAMKVFDVSAGYPGTLVQTITMVHILNGTYGASFTPVAGKQYVVNKMVYTDGTFSAANTAYSPGSESFQASAFEADVTTIKATTDNLEIKKNTALSNFTFLMFDDDDHLPLPGLTVTLQRSVDGAAFANCTNAVAEVGSGVYKIDLAASDLNGNVITFKATATGADANYFTVVTQP